MEPFLRAKLTRSVSCLRVAAAPVGLFGEQKKMMSVFLTCSRCRGGQFTGLFREEHRGRPASAR